MWYQGSNIGLLSATASKSKNIWAFDNCQKMKNCTILQNCSFEPPEFIFLDNWCNNYFANWISPQGFAHKFHKLFIFNSFHAFDLGRLWQRTLHSSRSCIRVLGWQVFAIPVSTMSGPQSPAEAFEGRPYFAFHCVMVSVKCGLPKDTFESDFLNLFLGLTQHKLFLKGTHLMDHYSLKRNFGGTVSQKGSIWSKFCENES